MREAEALASKAEARALRRMSENAQKQAATSLAEAALTAMPHTQAEEEEVVVVVAAVADGIVQAGEAEAMSGETETEHHAGEMEVMEAAQVARGTELLSRGEPNQRIEEGVETLDKKPEPTEQVDGRQEAKAEVAHPGLMVERIADAAVAAAAEEIILDILATVGASSASQVSSHAIAREVEASDEARDAAPATPVAASPQPVPVAASPQPVPVAASPQPVPVAASPLTAEVQRQLLLNEIRQAEGEKAAALAVVSTLNSAISSAVHAAPDTAAAVAAAARQAAALREAEEAEARAAQTRIEEKARMAVAEQRRIQMEARRREEEAEAAAKRARAAEEAKALEERWAMEARARAIAMAVTEELVVAEEAKEAKEAEAAKSRAATPRLGQRLPPPASATVARPAKTLGAVSDAAAKAPAPAQNMHSEHPSAGLMPARAAAVAAPLELRHWPAFAAWLRLASGWQHGRPRVLADLVPLARDWRVHL